MIWVNQVVDVSSNVIRPALSCCVMLCHVVRSVVSLSTTFAMIESHYLSLIQDAMMRHLNRKQDGFSHLVVADTAFDVFTRAQLGGEESWCTWCNCQKNSCGKVCRLRWCIAEFVESGRSRIRQQIKLLEGDSYRFVFLSWSLMTLMLYKEVSFWLLPSLRQNFGIHVQS